MKKILNSKSRTNLILTLVIVFVCLCSVIIMISYNNKLKELKIMENSLTTHIKNLEMLKGRVGKLHKRISRSFARVKRSVPLKNSTEFDQNGMTVGLQNDIQEAGNSCTGNCWDAVGTVYTRWGRKTCNNGSSELIYEGIVGGSWYEHTGAAVNPLCLPTQPLWNRFVEGSTNHAVMHGAEYEGFPAGIFSMQNSKSRTLLNENIPCAVCRTKSRNSIVMVPARNVCYPGWTLEYQGYLMAGYLGHKASSMYVCVDEAPEVTESGFRDEDGKLFYTVEARCGSLPCPEYIDGRELTCAVCSK